MKKRMKKLIAILGVCSLVFSTVPVSAQGTNDIVSEAGEETKENQNGSESQEETPVQEEVTSEEVMENGQTEESDGDLKETEQTGEKEEESGKSSPKESEEETTETPDESETPEEPEDKDVFAELAEKQWNVGRYSIRALGKSGFSAEVKGFSDKADVELQFAPTSTSLAQKFRIEQKENGWYTIKNVSSGKVLGVKEASAGAKLYQLDEKKGKPELQEFKFYEEEEGLIIRSNAGENLVCSMTEQGGFVLDELKIKAAQEEEDAQQKAETENFALQRFELKDEKFPYEEAEVTQGMYRIYPSAAERISLDVQGGKTNKGANVQLYTRNDTTAQEWRIVKEGEWYRIVNVKSNLVLDTKGGSKAKKANIQQYTKNSGNGQYFKFYKVDDNRYIIMSRLGMVVDCAGGKLTSRTNVQSYTNNNTKAQQWSLNRIVIPSTSEKAIGDGYYDITLGNGSGQLVIAGAKTEKGVQAQLGSMSVTGNQAFYVEKQKDGWYMLKNVNSGKYLDVRSGNVKPGAVLQQYTKNASANAQKFKFYDAGNGQYYIKSKLLTVIDAGNTNIIMNTADGQPKQKWQFKRVIPEKTAVNIADGDYHLFSALGNNMVMDIKGGSKVNGGNVQIWGSNKSMAQNYYIHKENDGWYTIKNNNSGKYLDAKGGSSKSGTNLWQYAGNKSSAQKFRFYDAGNGQYYIKSKLGTVIDVAGAKNKKGTNVQLYRFNASKAQRWTLKKAVKYPRWEYKDGYKFYYDANGNMSKDVSGVIGKQSSYEIKVNRKTCTVTVYAKDGKNGYIIPVKVFACSVGKSNTPTPSGTFYTPAKYRWHMLMGPSYGQYCTRITGQVLFHSVAGYNKTSYNLNPKDYNMLGQPASHGCVRLNVRDAKWIYDNCPLKTKVTIYDSTNPGPLGKPATTKIPSNQNWDPTDPNVRK